MDARQKQVVEAYQRVQDFLAVNPVPPPGSYGAPKELLDETVARLTDHSNDQAIGGRFGKADTRVQKTLRQELRELHLLPITKIAKATLKGKPGIDAALKMPAPQVSTTKLLADAAAFRAAAALYEATFVKNGRPADFVAQLDAASEAVRQTFLGQARNLGKQVGAKAGLAEEIKRGRDAVNMLDAIVTTTFARNMDVLAKWRSAKRVRASTGGSKPATPGATTQAPVQPTAPAAAQAAPVAKVA